VKFVLHMATMLAVLFIVTTTVEAQQTTRPTKGCLHNLAWQRWGYTKAHTNVIQSIRETQPDHVQWTHVASQHGCMVGIKRAKKLRLAEDSRWSKLRLQRSGVRWIIRRQFHSAGMDVVRTAFKVVSCESSFHWNAYNGADSGIWQINYVHHLPKYIMFSPELSTGWAWRASDHGRNFSPTWVCATRLGIA
jgi:hypothetical protein